MYIFKLYLILALLLSIPALLCRQLHRSCIVSGSLLRPSPFVEPDQRLEAHLIRQPVSVITLDGDGELVPLEQRPRLPPCVAVPMQRVLGVPPARPDLTLPLCHGIHRPQAYEGLITAILPRLLRDDPQQRALGAAVRLLQGQLLVDKIPFWHISKFFFRSKWGSARMVCLSPSRRACSPRTADAARLKNGFFKIYRVN